MMLGMRKSGFMLSWSMDRHGDGGVAVMAKELCEKVVEVRRVTDIVMVNVFDRGCVEVDVDHALHCQIF